MSKFLVRFTVVLVKESEYHNSLQEFADSLDVGSRCWESELVEQLHEESEKATEKSVCNLGYRCTIEALEMLPNAYPDLPVPLDVHKYDMHFA